MRPLPKIVCLSALLVLPAGAGAALPVGARAPVFATRAALAGKEFGFDLASALKKGPVVLYFFPKVFTQGCTVEAHEFAESTEEFNRLVLDFVARHGVHSGR